LVCLPFAIFCLFAVFCLFSAFLLKRKKAVLIYIYKLSFGHSQVLNQLQWLHRLGTGVAPQEKEERINEYNKQNTDYHRLAISGSHEELKGTHSDFQ